MAMDEWEGRLRVAMFTNVYLPSTNGVVVSVEAFRRALTKLGHDVFIFGPDSGDIEDRAPYVFRYPAVELPLQKYPLTLPVSPYVDRLLGNLKPHVLHANHPALLGRVAARKSEQLDLPLVFTYHTRYTDYSHYAKPFPEDKVKDFIAHWLASFMTKCHHVVVPSQSIKKILNQRYGLDAQVSVVPTGIELEKFAACSRAEARRKLGWREDEKILISVGRLAKEKNFDLLLEAVGRADPQLRLIIVGSGDEQTHLEELARSLGLAERVTFTGVVAFGDIPVYLAASDLFVFASVTETQGLVTLEAMASGLPVVAVDASGTRDAVCPGCSILTEADPQALAQGITQMLGRGDLHQESETARERAGKFSLISQGQAMVEVYRRAQEAHLNNSRVLLDTRESQSRWQEFLDFFRL